jgi:hypothetical protein
MKTNKLIRVQKKVNHLWAVERKHAYSDRRFLDSTYATRAIARRMIKAIRAWSVRDNKVEQYRIAKYTSNKVDWILKCKIDHTAENRFNRAIKAGCEAMMAVK